MPPVAFIVIVTLITMNLIKGPQPPVEKKTEVVIEKPVSPPVKYKSEIAKADDFQ